MLATAASASDTAAGVTLLSRIAATHPHITKARADARCRTTAIDHGARHGIDVRPVQRPPGARGFTIIPRRWTIERSVGSLMHHRHLARDYETHPHRSEAVIHLAMIDLMARSLTGESHPEDHLARRPPDLGVLRETDPEHVQLDGTLAECDRVGDSRTDFSQRHRRHGVNEQVVTDPGGELLWISPTLPGRTHDLTAAITHRIIRICERQGVPVLADRAYIGAGPCVTTPIRRLPHQDLTPTQRTINRALSAARAPVERSIARVKSWRIFRRARCSPNRMTVIAEAGLTLEGQRSKPSVI